MKIIDRDKEHKFNTTQGEKKNQELEQRNFLSSRDFSSGMPEAV